jgi:GT2 family glycosyltransferase
VRREEVVQALVLVLVDEQDPKLPMGLPLERCKQAPELLDSADRGDDKVESHGRTLTPVPLVSVLMSVHDDARFVGEAVQSVLGQTLTDLELIVVDDASTDATPDVLAGLGDPRVNLMRNDERSGLAVSLNRGLDAAQGGYVARLDSDDIAVPDRLRRQLERIEGEPRVAVVGTAVRDVDEHGAVGRLHRSPLGPRGVRWLSLFSSPFFHPTVLVDRERLEELGLRYDSSFLESEDYDLWTRLLRHSEGANLAEPLVLKRVHAGQASQRRGDVQESFQRRVALREIARLAPHLDADGAWRVGARKPHGERRQFVRLLAAFERTHGRDRAVRSAAFRALLSPRRRS